jgi:hypothetical protein
LPPFCGITKFITLLTRAIHCFQTWAIPIQSKLSHSFPPT